MEDIFVYVKKKDYLCTPIENEYCGLAFERMKNEALVSIITPCHNSACCIRETIESVLQQDYPYWEMLISDDGSSDDTVRIVSEYAHRDSRIKLFHQDKKSGSPAAPRNNSLEHATGKYIAFLDSDDIWLPNKLSEQVAFAEANDYPIVYSYYEKMSHIGERSNRVIKTDASYDYAKIVQTDGVPWLTLMVRRDCMGDLRFVKAEKEDYIFLIKLLKKGYTAYNTCRLHAVYRETIGSRSGNKLKMLMGQWNVIRTYANLSIPKAMACMLVYAFHGLRKYFV